VERLDQLHRKQRRKNKRGKEMIIYTCIYVYIKVITETKSHREFKYNGLGKVQQVKADPKVCVPMFLSLKTHETPRKYMNGNTCHINEKHIYSGKRNKQERRYKIIVTCIKI
jgi:hypothetical protein